MSGFNDYVTVVNRTSKALPACWNGKHYDIAPGDNWLPKIIGMAAKEQNVVPGSEDPYTLACDYYIGIKEDQDDCSPIKERATAIERLNRKALGGKSFDGKELEIIKGNTGIIPNKRVGAEGMQSVGPVETGFVDPKS